MAVPPFHAFFRPVLETLAKAGMMSWDDLWSQAPSRLDVTEADLAEMIPSGSQTRVDSRLHWSCYYLKRAGLIRDDDGSAAITDEGRALLARRDGPIGVPDLREYPSFVEFEGGSQGGRGEFNMADGTWTLRADVQEKIRAKAERSIPDQAVREAALRLLAFAIENADEERSDAWC